MTSRIEESSGEDARMQKMIREMPKQRQRRIATHALLQVIYADAVKALEERNVSVLFVCSCNETLSITPEDLAQNRNVVRAWFLDHHAEGKEGHSAKSVTINL